MSKLAIQLLTDLDLLEREGRPSDLSRFSDTNLRAALREYQVERERKLAEEIKHEASPNGHYSALVSSVSAVNEPSSLLPSALVYDRMYTDDALFAMAAPDHPMLPPTRRSMGMSDEAPFDRRWLAEALTYFAEMAPLIRAGALSVLPLSHCHRAPDDLPLYASDDGFISEVPHHIRGFVHESALIREVVVDTDRMLILSEPPKSPTRAIAVSFKDDDTVPGGMVFILSTMQLAEHPDGGGRAIRQTVDWSNPPGPQQFALWVFQSINRAILSRLTRISTEMHLARALNAIYMTQSQFEARLVGLSAEKSAPPDTRTPAVNFLRANAPFLRVGSAELVATIRQDNPMLFEKFRASLYQVSAELSEVTTDFDLKAQQLYAREIEPQIQTINTLYAKASATLKGGVGSAAVSVAFALMKAAEMPIALLLSVLTGATAVQGLSNALPAIAEYRQKRNTPAFIWSRIAKS